MNVLSPSMVTRGRAGSGASQKECYARRRGAQRDAGTDECLVTNPGNARAGLVSDHSRWMTGMAHYGLAVAARFLCLLSLRRQRK
jgi:hypothetical protein